MHEGRTLVCDVAEVPTEKLKHTQLKCVKQKRGGDDEVMQIHMFTTPNRKLDDFKT